MREWAVVLGRLLAVCVVLTACSTHHSQPKASIGLVAAASGSGYNVFNAEANAGLAVCHRATGATISTAVPPASDYGPQLVLLATESSDAILAIGPPAANDVARTARRFETTHFVILDAFVAAPNVNSVSFNMQEGSFLAGALAAMTSKTRSVAFLGGADIEPLRQYEAGFFAGVREIDPHFTVRRRYVGSFVDRAEARRQAAALFESGSDIVYAVAGPAGAGAIAAAQEHPGAFVIAADSDQDRIAPGKVLTSVLKRVDVATLRACLLTVAQKPATGLTALGLAEGGVTLTTFPYTREYIGAVTIARLQRIRRAIVAGTLVPPASDAALARFQPIAIP